MNKYIVILLLALIGGPFFNTFSQEKKDDEKDRIEQLKSQKVAFITKHLDLSTSEAQEFWPVYNEFSDKMDELRNKTKKNIINLHKTLDSLSEAEKEAAIDKHIEYELREAKLEKEYHEHFKEILSIDKVIKLYEAEHEFKKKMLKLLREGGKSSSCNDKEGERIEDIV
ncbi:MAG: hypothetical protein ACOCV9_03485 [Marinilabiliaceae bacterium]